MKEELINRINKEIETIENDKIIEIEKYEYLKNYTYTYQGLTDLEPSELFKILFPTSVHPPGVVTFIIKSSILKLFSKIILEAPTAVCVAKSKESSLFNPSFSAAKANNSMILK